MCRMTDTGVRGADAIDNIGLWYVSSRRAGGPMYLLDRSGNADMFAFRPDYRIRVKVKADGGAGE